MKVATVSMYGDNTQYKLMEPWMIDLDELRSKPVKAGTYRRQELIDLVEGKIELTQFDDEDPRISRTNKLEGITEMVFNLDKLDNADNLKYGKPSNTLFTYHVTAYNDSVHFEPYAPQYEKLKNI